MTVGYQKPVIDMLQGGMMNKFGFTPGSSQKVKDRIDGVPVSRLTEEHGSPLFVFSEKTIRTTHRRVTRAFTTRYPNVTLAWSYKTNYLGAICKIMHQEGSIAEVVSGMEYEKARSNGIPGADIIFNGPYKPLPDLTRAVEEGATVNIDHEDEIEDLEEVTASLGVKARVGIRINLDSGIQPQWSRFGFNLESGQAMQAVERILKSGRLDLSGIHCHIGTFILDPEAYGVQVQKLVEFMYSIEERSGVEISFLDIGGGLPSKSRLKNTYLPADIATPPVEDYAERICNQLLESLRPNHYPQLIIESGRAMIDESGTLITSVHASKRLPDGRRAYVLDAGLNLLFTSFWYKFNIEFDRPAAGLPEPSVLYGPLCMNIDVIDEGLTLPPLERGTRLMLSPVGAYSVTQWMQFIHYRPTVVLVTESGEVEVIRVQEDLKTMTAPERIPALTSEEAENDEGAESKVLTFVA